MSRLAEGQQVGVIMRASKIAERALLGAILLDPARLADVEQWLEPGDFYAYRHGVVYTEMLDLRRTDQQPTARAVLDRVIPSADSRRLVDGPYLHTLMESCPHPSRAAIYGRMVLEASIHRRTAERAEHLDYVAQSEAPADVVIDELDREVADWLAAIQALEHRWARAGGNPSTAKSLDTCGLCPTYPQIADEAAEVSVIASLLASPWQYDQVKGWLTPEDFTRADTRALFTSIIEVVKAGEPVDVVTVMRTAIHQAGVIGRLAIRPYSTWRMQVSRDTRSWPVALSCKRAFATKLVLLHAGWYPLPSNPERAPSNSPDTPADSSTRFLLGVSDGVLPRRDWRPSS